MAGKLPANWDAKSAEFIAAVDKKAETIASVITSYSIHYTKLYE